MLLPTIHISMLLTNMLLTTIHINMILTNMLLPTIYISMLLTTIHLNATHKQQERLDFIFVNCNSLLVSKMVLDVTLNRIRGAIKLNVWVSF